MQIVWGVCKVAADTNPYNYAISFNSTYALINGGLGADRRARNGEPMSYDRTLTGTKFYYTDGYYINQNGGVSFVALGF